MRLHPLKVTIGIGMLFVVSLAIGGRGTNHQQDPSIVCPVVAVSCPDKVTGGAYLHVYATVTGSGRDKLKYNWTVTWPAAVRKGRIKSGQGTPSLVVSVPRRARGSVTVTVEVFGLDPSCRMDSSSSIVIGRN
jgi:hypothetical protein